MNCQCCGKDRDLRMGHCFACVEAESIINDGVDMFDKGINGKDKPAKTAMEKLKFLISKGWDK